MATFLQLCQDVARESGVVSGTSPVTVVSQTGILGKIVSWTSNAWVSIQNMHGNWRWMRGEFSVETTAGTKRYTDVGWNITRFGEWLCEPGSISAYLTADGVAGEYYMREVRWDMWKAQYDRRTQSQGTPYIYAISPTGEFCVGPTPDDEYTIRGEYRKTPQILSADADIPECPARFHQLIVYRALMYLAQHDEAGNAYAPANAEFGILLNKLERDQRPRMEIYESPIA